MIENVERLLDVMARAHDPDGWGMGNGLSRRARVQRMKNALLAAQAEGAEMVPSEAAQVMCNAAVDATRAGKGMSWRNLSPQGLFRRGYTAMLTANPLRIKE